MGSGSDYLSEAEAIAAGAAIAAWAAAESLGDLRELTARWLEGGISWIPSYCCAEPAPETTDLIPTLAALNRGGFMTENSQPGERLDGGCVQRAGVVGFCTEQTAQTLAAACMPTDLFCLVSWPGCEDGPFVPVTIADDQAHTWFGPPMSPGHLRDSWGEALSPDGLEALTWSWQVTVIDPVWGRNDLLWPTISAAIAGPPAIGALPPFE